ncbi:MULTISPECIES: hypothetical protein [Dickeya]|uniref:hypothetical protein n=1 Tax=Dickeya TaxID=204037 RepID=UPI0003A62783|nr:MULTISPECIES: hypothetical protein [Dickeya]UGA49964.1 hypothetical protein QR68_15465 [Dickeya fangzhongdai]UWH06315.1 hypothetical protein K0H75_15470 [Dickeya fangzhongdai]
MILVTGASGHLGQRVLHHLSETLAIPISGIVAAGRVATVTDDFQQITGIAPQTFSDWLNANQTWLEEI